jgi:sigma-B regulation protein RsbU (phosphoserine phosphatase)
MIRVTAGDILREKIKRLEFLATASRMLNATLDLEQLLLTIMKIVKNALDVQAVSLSVVDEKGETLVFELASGRRDHAVRGLKIPFGEGVMGWVAQHQKPLVVNDTRNDQRVSMALERKLGIKPRSILAVPLKRRGRLIGVLEAINRKEGRKFTEEDLSLSITLGGHIAAAVGNARLFQRAERRRLEASLLARASADVGGLLSLDEVLQRILANLRRLVPFDAAAIFVLDPRQKRVVSKLHQGYPAGTDERLRFKSDEGVVSVAIKEKKGIIVDDVRASKNYVKARESTRSEMVAPMLSQGRVMGAFNLESDQIHAYREDDLQLLEAFASHASVAIERANLYEEQREKQEIQEELRVARTVQDFFSPKRSRAVGPLRIAGANYPSLEVSGDYYDFFPVREGRLAFAVADVAGKGVPAALIMSGFRATLHTAAPYVATARQLALRANEILLETVRPQDFVTAFIAVVNPTTGEVTYCNAGHNAAILMKPDGSFRTLESGGPVLGLAADIPLVEGRFVLRDETLLLFTDGATEARNQSGEYYGDARLVAALRRSVQFPPSPLCHALYGDVKAFFGEAGQADDITFLVLKRRK